MGISKTNTTKQVNVFDPQNLSENDCENNLRNFLNNSNQILVVDQELFTGCESSNIIYLYDDYSAQDFMRCALLRAVAHLTLIYAIDNDYGVLMSFDGFVLEPKKLKCIKTLKDQSWICDSCNKTNICKSCSYFCHRQHQLLSEGYRKNKGKPCQCHKSKTCKI